MDLHLIGLGKMGKNMAMRLIQKGHSLHVFDTNEAVMAEMKGLGASVYENLDALMNSKRERKLIWVMVPSGDITQNMVRSVLARSNTNDVIIDGGNSNYKSSQALAKDCLAKGVFFLDCGTSGGVWGLTEGYCLMVGGDRSAFDFAEPIFKDLAQDLGYEYTGPSGSGHYTKMIHNGIEYAMMQAYAEGFELLTSHSEFKIDTQKIASLWQHGSVVRSWLLELLESAFKKDADLSGLVGYVEDSGEGRWSVIDAVEQSVPAPTITAALFERFRSRKTNTFANRILAALRKEFGGHEVKK